MPGVKDTDKGYAELVKTIYGLAHPRVAVGIFEAGGQVSAGQGVTLIEVAIWNEFGVEGHIPARSFIRAWFDENIDQAKETLTKLMQAVLAGKLSKAAALNQFGLWMQGQVQARIARGIPPENAESTVLKKGKSKPLVNTGQLRSSVTFAVDMGSGELAVHETRGG